LVIKSFGTTRFPVQSRQHNPTGRIVELLAVMLVFVLVFDRTHLHYSHKSVRNTAETGPLCKMDSTDYHWVEWLITFVLGLAILWTIIRRGWARPRQSFSGKFIICFFAACTLTPFYRSETLSGITDADFLPLSAVIMRCLYAFVGVDSASGFWIMFKITAILICSLLAASLFLATVWSIFVNPRLRAWIAENAE
jgi:hypothetical protein